MAKRKYTIRLTKKERKELRSIVSKGKSASRTIMRATVLQSLDGDAGQKCNIGELCKVLFISKSTFNKIQKNYRKKRNSPPV